MVAAGLSKHSLQAIKNYRENNQEKYLEAGTRLYMTADEVMDIEFEADVQ